MRIVAGNQEVLIKDKLAIRFEAKGDMCKLYLLNGRSMLLEANLDSIEEQLASSSFIRVHHNYLVNAEHISSIPEKASECICLSDGECIPVDAKSLIRLKEIIEKHINP